MKKRLQVILDDHEYRWLRQAAESEGVSLSEWVRRALRTARDKGPLKDTEKKSQVLNAALKHSFPTGDIGQILSEISFNEDPSLPLRPEDWSMDPKA